VGVVGHKTVRIPVVAVEDIIEIRVGCVAQQIQPLGAGHPQQRLEQATALFRDAEEIIQAGDNFEKRDNDDDQACRDQHPLHGAHTQIFTMVPMPLREKSSEYSYVSVQRT